MWEMFILLSLSSKSADTYVVELLTCKCVCSGHVALCPTLDTPSARQSVGWGLLLLAGKKTGLFLCEIAINLCIGISFL